MAKFVSLFQKAMEVNERVIPTTFVKPVTKIKSVEMLKTFLESELCRNYVQFLEDLNESVCGKEKDIEVTISPVWVYLEFIFIRILSFIDRSKNVSLFRKMLRVG